MFKPRKYLKNRTSTDMSVETIGYSKRYLRIRGLKFIGLIQRWQNFRPSSTFDSVVPFLNSFRSFTSIRKSIGLSLKHVATVSVSERYQTSLFPQYTKTLLENVNFDLICQLFNDQ